MNTYFEWLSGFKSILSRRAWREGLLIMLHKNIKAPGSKNKHFCIVKDEAEKKDWKTTFGKNLPCIKHNNRNWDKLASPTGWASHSLSLKLVNTQNKVPPTLKCHLQEHENAFCPLKSLKRIWQKKVPRIYTLKTSNWLHSKTVSSNVESNYVTITVQKLPQRTIKP